MARPSSLSKPAPDLVLGLLKNSKQPLTAYAILSKLKKNGINSAPIIYRALDSLIIKGSIHKIKELGAYVACDCTQSHNHEVSVLTVCNSCKKVEELHDHKIIHQIEGLRAQGVRIASHAIVELPVICDSCSA
jgi:Fur family zinc uptake transcriptional regulator